MARGKLKKALDALIFIDANIYLDFYRARGKNFEASMIKHIEQNRNKIITTDQIYMEYKKNRQKVILDSLGEIQNPTVNVMPPAILSDTMQMKMINKSKKELKNQIKKLKDRVSGILTKPKTRDSLYQSLQRIFKDENVYHLGRKNNLRFRIRSLARKRYALGYPPRKDKDLSIGDAINWEWIIYCAEQSGKDIIIVSRDKDYGETFNDELILNDWLQHEFKDRISARRKIILTNKLSDAFKLIDVKISAQEEELEKELISTRDIKDPEFYRNLDFTKLTFDFEKFNKIFEKNLFYKVGDKLSDTKKE